MISKKFSYQNLMHGKCSECGIKLVKIIPMTKPNDPIFLCEKMHMRTRRSLIDKILIEYQIKGKSMLKTTAYKVCESA